MLTVSPNHIGVLKEEMHRATRRHFFDPLVVLLRAATGSGAFAIVDVEATATVVITPIFAETVHRNKEDVVEPPVRSLKEQARFSTDLPVRGLSRRRARARAGEGGA